MLYKERLQKPYFWEKYAMRHSTTFNARGESGVYQIFKNGVLRYVGYSGSDVYKAMYRHFQKWEDSTQTRITYNPEKVKVRVTYTNTAAQAENLEKALIIKKKPKDNPRKYYLDYDTDEKENKIYTEFINEPTQPIVHYKGEVPF